MLISPKMLFRIYHKVKLCIYAYCMYVHTHTHKVIQFSLSLSFFFFFTVYYCFLGNSFTQMANR